MSGMESPQVKLSSLPKRLALGDPEQYLTQGQSPSLLSCSAMQDSS